MMPLCLYHIPPAATEAYPLGRTVRQIRSTTSVRAAELVRRPGPP